MYRVILNKKDGGFSVVLETKDRDEAVKETVRLMLDGYVAELMEKSEKNSWQKLPIAFC